MKKENKKKMRKYVRNGLLTTLGVFALAASAFTYNFSSHYRLSSGSDYSGQEKISGLSAPMNVYRDAYGIPHIFAMTPNDGARALGYLHASERLFQMETQRRAGQGRLSEIFGADMLGVDKFTRTLGLYHLAQSSFAAMSPEAQSYIQAYSDGVNAWLVTHKNKLPPEFFLLHATPEPWQPADSVVWGKLMALELSHNYHLEVLRAELTKKMPLEQMQWLFPMPSVGTPITTQPIDTTQSSSQDPATKLASLIGLSHAASNEWVIGGMRTVTGKPMLANDPHLDLTAPILWYLARIVTPQGSVKGATAPGTPLFLLGQTDHLAWGFTTTGDNTQRLFVETRDTQNPNKYLTPQGSADFIERTEVIHVKNASDVVLKTRATRHGPVLSDIDPKMASLAGSGKVMALAFTGLGDKDTTSEALIDINHAQNAAELFKALKWYQTPTQNLAYADSDGNFGYISPGFVPISKEGDGLMPADGTSGKEDWIGIIPLERDPQIANPSAGYVFNANNAVVGKDSVDYFGQDWEEPYRARRLQQFFNTSEKFTLEKMASMQADTLSLVATDFLPLLAKIAPLNQRDKDALDRLLHWDGVMDKDKPESALFEAWLYEFHNHMLPEKTGVDMSEKGPFAAMTLMDLIKNHAQGWCGDSECRAMMTHSFADAMNWMTQRQGPDMNQWRWGRENVASLSNKFYSHIPGFKGFSDLSVPTSGDFYTLDRGGGFDNDAKEPFRRTHGGGFRGLYDLADSDKSCFMIATGESGEPFSPHYGDLVDLWKNVKCITLNGSERDFQLQKAPELVLTP